MFVLPTFKLTNLFQSMLSASNNFSILAKIVEDLALCYSKAHTKDILS